VRRVRYEVVLGIILLVIAGASTCVAANRLPAKFVPVLLYHDLSDRGPSQNGMTLTVREFEHQISVLKANGYNPITSDDLYCWLSRKKKLPARPIFITFDDGYESVYVHAYPILKKYGFKATVFLLGSTVNTKNHLTWAQIGEMVRSNTVEIGSHTYAGHGGTSHSPDYLSWTLDEALSDFQKFARVCREQGIESVRSFAYPFGASNEIIERAVRQSEYVLAFTTQPGVVRRGDDPLHLKRITVWPGNTGARFLAKIRLALRVSMDDHNDTGLPSAD